REPSSPCHAAARLCYAPFGPPASDRHPGEVPDRLIHRTWCKLTASPLRPPRAMHRPEAQVFLLPPSSSFPLRSLSFLNTLHRKRLPSCTALAPSNLGSLPLNR